MSRTTLFVAVVVVISLAVSVSLFTETPAGTAIQFGGVAPPPNWPEWIPVDLPDSLSVADGAIFWSYIHRVLRVSPPAGFAGRKGPVHPEPAGENFATFTTTPYTVGVTPDFSVQELETSHVAVDDGGLDYTVVGYMQEINPGPGNGYILKTAATKTGDGFWTYQTLSRSGYPEAIDPALHVNYSSGGVGPKRVYCGGILWQGVPGATPNAMVVWRSTTKGFSWSSPTFVEVNSTNNASVLQARFNSVANVIGVVWHAKPSSSSTKANVYFTRKSAAGWNSVRSIAADSQTDQFQPQLILIRPETLWCPTTIEKRIVRIETIKSAGLDSIRTA